MVLCVVLMAITGVSSREQKDREPQVTGGGTERNGADRTSRSIAAVREFFAALEAMDIPRFLAVWAENGVQEMPFAPGSFPRRLEGRAAIERQYGPLPAAFSSMRFPIRRLVTGETPGLVVVEYDGSIALKAGGRYDNRYVGIFQFDEGGKLTHFAEYFDPLTLIRGFPGAAPLARSDEEQVRDAILSLATAADRRDWTAVAAVFADDVDVDYTSVVGGTPATVSAANLVTGWKQGLERYQTTKHHFTDVQVTVTGHTARATFTGQATHLKANGERWSCGGDYEYQFVRSGAGWKARAATFHMRWEQGVR